MTGGLPSVAVFFKFPSSANFQRTPEVSSASAIAQAEMLEGSPLHADLVAPSSSFAGQCSRPNHGVLVVHAGWINSCSVVDRRRRNVLLMTPCRPPQVVMIGMRLERASLLSPSSAWQAISHSDTPYYWLMRAVWPAAAGARQK
jgi:hypothetical protein